MSTPSSPLRTPVPRTVPASPLRPSSPLRPVSPSSLRSASGTTLASRHASTSASQPGAPSASAPAQGDRQKTRARDLLRKHYGLGIGLPPAAQGRSSDPMDLDSSAFDAKAYYEQLITTSSLPALLKCENELLTEIRQLDSERQSLVYNHHHELIAASDTIGAMTRRAESLDPDMELLKTAFSEISRLYAEVIE